MDLYQQIFFTTLALAFALLHFFLYYYNSKNKSNLFFAIFLIFYALNIFLDFQNFISPYESKLIYLRLHRAVAPYNSIFALLFTYSIFNYKIPKQFWIIATVVALSGIYAVIDPVENFIYLIYLSILVYLEISRVILMAFREKRADVRLIATGYIILFIFSIYDLLMDVGLYNAFYGIHNGYPFGFLALIITISIHLARDYARISEKIIEQEAENRRKSKELEEARNLQLSLLPDCAPEMKNLDICFDMKTASEVGGDYYDYFLAEDGSIIFAIGDATGHGMKAGILVTIIKSLFLSHVNNLDMHSFFNQCSMTIKKMNLGNLYMAMMLVKIENKKLIASSAGIPGILIYRKISNSIEEFLIKGMPLGAFNTFAYQTIETNLENGDIVLLMTDGLAEQFNIDGEEFDFPRIKDVFLKNVELSPDEIVQQMFKAGNDWRKKQIQNDDITFVAIKQN